MVSFKSLCLVSALAAVTATGAVAETIKINGAGATFPFPLYSKWFSDYTKVDKDAQINYQSIGSGGGIKQFTEGVVDFGASDTPMTDEQMAKLKIPALHIPTALGAVVVTYNLKEVADLKLTSATLADIFLGKITTWNDKAIAEANPKAKLPSTKIIVAHRSDGSGTSGIFTDYLAKVSKEWKDKVGAGTAVNWPAGLGGKGNEGVTGLVKGTPGSLGYVELIYAEKNKLSHASIKNKSGNFVSASMTAVTEAAAGSLKNMPADFRVSITDAEGKGAYPIAGFTYLLVSQTMGKVKGEKIVKFLKWALTDGQKTNESLQYSKLPDELAKKVLAKVDTIKLSEASGH